MNIRSAKRVAAAVFALGCFWLGSTPAANAEWVRCAREHGYCATPFPTMVRYGAHAVYARRHTRGGGIPCDNAVFGDPLVGIVKHCDFWAGD
jgi:hypothetical protein